MIQLDPSLDDLSIDPQTRACLRLWATVLHAGVEDAAQAFKDKRVHDPAYHWLYSEADYPGSFVWLCDLFGYDPENARSRARMKFRSITRAKTIKEKKNACE